MKLLKFSVVIFLQKTSDSSEHPIKIEVRWNKLSYRFSLGVSFPPNSFDKGRCVRGSKNSKGHTAIEVNKELDSLEQNLEYIFKSYRDSNATPTKDQIKNEILMLKNGGVKKDEVNILWIDFLSKKRDATQSTIIKYRQIKRKVLEEYPNITLAEISSETFLESLVQRLITLGYAPPTINKHIDNLKHFLFWLKDNHYTTNVPTVKKLRSIKKPVLFLALDELKLIMEHDFSASLSTERDMFVFQCLTGLRDGDLRALTKSNFHDGCITFTTQKTNDTITIPLSPKAKEIIDRYSDTKGNILLPVNANQVRNRSLKTICASAGITSAWQYEEIKGNRRVSRSGMKCEFVTTHTARKTFVCVALSLGIPPNVIMKITGHSDYKAMLPYIDVAGAETKKAVEKMNDALGAASTTVDENNILKERIRILESQIREITESLKKNED